MIQIEIELHHWQTQKDGLWRVSTDNPSDLPIFVADVETQFLDIHFDHTILLVEKGYQTVRIFTELVILDTNLNDRSIWKNSSYYIDIHLKVQD